MNSESTKVRDKLSKDQLAVLVAKIAQQFHHMPQEGVSKLELNVANLLDR